VPTTLVTLACRDGYERAAHLYPALQPASAHVLPPEVSVVEVPLLVG
jgi:predicted alpha/beta hydrolase